MKEEARKAKEVEAEVKRKMKEPVKKRKGWLGRRGVREEKDEGR